MGDAARKAAPGCRGLAGIPLSWRTQTAEFDRSAQAGALGRI